MLYKTAKRIVIAVIGVTVLLLSIVGYVLPVVPGIPLTFLGLAILATEFIWARRLLRRVKASAQDLVTKFTGAKKVPAPATGADSPHSAANGTASGSPGTTAPPSASSKPPP
ncbi:MAG: hypothetical protein DCC65_07370 [Planctomycetota bacterium]|nr:MAG: hypothetical protein DCC65_07370 [Planctomycetota bacterium]